MNAFELFRHMPLDLAAELLNHAHAHAKPLYRELVATAAKLRRVRPVVIQRTPRSERHPYMIAMLQQPPAITTAYQVISSWLLESRQPMLTAFLDRLRIPHDGHGCVETFPESPPDDASLRDAIDYILASHPEREVALYLHAFHSMPESGWANLGALLQSDPRFNFGAAPEPEPDAAPPPDATPQPEAPPPPREP